MGTRVPDGFVRPHYRFDLLHSSIDVQRMPKRRARVQAHGEIEEDFTGEVTRVDEDNYLFIVRHPETGQVWGCNNAFVTLFE